MHKPTILTFSKASFTQALLKWFNQVFGVGSFKLQIEKNEGLIELKMLLVVIGNSHFDYSAGFANLLSIGQSDHSDLFYSESLEMDSSLALVLNSGDYQELKELMVALMGNDAVTTLDIFPSPHYLILNQIRPSKERGVYDLSQFELLYPPVACPSSQGLP